MKNAGPNEPCPCGSGKKFKRCCAQKQSPAVDPELELAARLHDRDHRLCDDLLEFASKRFDKGLIPGMAEEFPGDFEEHPALLELFIPWALYGEQVDGKPVARWFLEEQRRPLDSDDRRWIEAQLAGYISLWIVEQTEPGRALHLRDLLTGERRRVSERQASLDAQENLVLLGRVVDFDGISVLQGLHFQPLGPAAASEIVDAWRSGAKVRKKLVPVEKLREPDASFGLIDLWDAYVQHMRSHGMPTLQNTDGEELLFTRDLFRFPPGKRAEVLKKLSGIAGADVEPTKGGQTELAFLRPGNKQHKNWDNTVMGHAVLDADSLQVETNSLARADRLREQVEQACAGLLEHRLRDHQDPAATLSRQPRPAGPEAAAAPRSAETMEMLKEVKQRHYEGWLDQPLPALKGKTPREAARTPKGRERVDLLLREIEMIEARLPDEERFDVASLRQDLGV